MTYDEWLLLIKRLEKSSNKEDVERFINEPTNENLGELLRPKIKTMIYNRLYNTINNLIDNLSFAFESEEELDLYMVNFKKSINQTRQLVNCNQLIDPDKIELNVKIKVEINKTYDILIDESVKDRDDGVLESIINKNRIKWSDENELSGS